MKKGDSVSTITSSRRRPWIVVASALIAVALLATLGFAVAGFVRSHATPAPAPAAAPSSSFPTVGANEQVATVNGQPIPMRELQIYLSKDRAAVLARYQSNPAAGKGDRFWNQIVDGGTPAELLTQSAMADVKKTTVQLQLAAQYKLIADPSYSSFLTAFNAENNRRATAIANHQPVYGPVQYTEANYLDYVIGQYAYELEPKLEADGSLPVTDADLNAYYTANAAQFASPDGTPADPTQPATQTQIRRAFLDAEYQQLVAGLASRAATIETDTHTITSGGCLATGTCTS